MERFRIAALDFGIKDCTGVCAVSDADKNHPNKQPFVGTLLVLDTASDKPPHGAEGHRIYVPKSVAEKRLPSLIGMALNFEEGLSGHAPQRKVGVITGAWIDGKKVKVSGHIWRKDFPSALRQLRSASLGMSMELAEVWVKEKDAEVWTLEDFHFSGATALRKSAAAYHATALAAAAASLGILHDEVSTMGNGKEVKRMAAAGDPAKASPEVAAKALADVLGPVLQAAVEKGNGPLVAAIEAQAEQSKVVLEAVQTLQETAIAAATQVDKGEKDDIKAADEDKDEEKDEEEDVEEKDEEADEEEMEAEIEQLAKGGAEQEPGELNKNAKNKGGKTAVSASALPRILAAFQGLRATLQKERKARKADRKTFTNKIEAMEAQLEAAADLTNRRSLPTEALSLLAKASVDVDSLRSEGRKLSVGEVDAMFAHAGATIDPATRMAIKNQLLQADLMDEGRIERRVQ